MSELELFGSLTSPYVRRVRIVAQELGVETELVDTTTELGQVALRDLNPLWKVPAARLRGQALLDSVAIQRELMAAFGPGPLAPQEPNDVETSTRVTVIDGALDALINAFYLAKEGVQSPYLAKQRGRAAAALGWIEGRVDGPWLTSARQFGLPEIALVTAVEWMRFRNAYEVDRHPAIVACVAAHASRPSVTSTAPPL